MSLNDIYQVKLFSDLNIEDMLNVFYYQQVSVSPVSGAEDLCDVFNTGIVAYIQQLSSTAVTIRQIQVVNGSNNLDNFVQDLTTVGIQGASAPPNISMAFRRRTGGVGFRYSYKRFSGVPIASVSLNGWLDLSATYIGYIEEMAAALGNNLVGTVGSYQPVQITGGFELGVAPVFKQALTGDWQYNDRPSHQDTRQQFEWKSI